jgi:lipid-binding SYLF domain-containing protein
MVGPRCSFMRLAYFGAWSASLALLLLTSLSCGKGAQTPAQQSSDERARAKELLDDSSAVVKTVSSVVPADQRQQARCVVVVPALVSGGFVVGARHGDGVVTCRTARGWSPPAFVSISGGSAGLQIGVESADVVMLVKNERGLWRLFRSSLELGADTSAAAGPAGRAVQASTDATLTADIVAYARSRGLFAGVELSGAAMTQDRTIAGALYGGSPDVHAILGGDVPPPSEVNGFLADVSQAFPPIE